MGKKAQTQWDFGDLFAPPSPPSQPTEAPSATSISSTASVEAAVSPSRKILTVAELTAQVKRLLEKQIGEVWVTGEVTNCRVQSSGHVYFTLKDADSQLNCVLFRNEARGNRELLQDGRKVLVQGELTVYEPRGQYQLRVTAVELQGIGALQAAFEKLKQKLNAEGLFASDRKRELPRYPQRIGIVTSPTGAAIRDVLHVVRRRNPALQIVLAPCRVQGQGAAEEIAEAIRLVNDYSKRETTKLDLVLVTRGGGSLEDLWAFNEEVVARAIFESALPVVSAVGHEIDFTISDFVADVRAATPSAAAEIITEGVFSSLAFVAEAAERMRFALRAGVDDKRNGLAQLGRRLSLLHPRRRFNEWLQRLDDLELRSLRCARMGVRDRRIEWRNVSERLLRLRPANQVRQRRELLTRLEARVIDGMRQQLRSRSDRLAALESQLRLLGPQQVLARGYSITMDAASGKVLRDAKAVKRGQKLRTRLKSGEVRSIAEK